jgi:hypothetical protein
MPADILSNMKIEKLSPDNTNRTSDTEASEDTLRSNSLGWTHTIGSLTAQLNLEKPGDGISLKSGNTSNSILGICLPQQALTFNDGWVRGYDATGIYAMNDARQLQTSGLWRLQGTWCPTKDIENSLTAELILSSETLREKSDGSLAVQCVFQARTVQTGTWCTNSFHWEPETLRTCAYWSESSSQTVAVQCFAFQLPEFEQTLAVFTRSDEIHHTVMTSTPAKESHAPDAYKYVLKSYFFPTIIEKGVLHRGRIVAVLGPSRTGKDWCTAAASAFARQPPLLQ